MAFQGLLSGTIANEQYLKATLENTLSITEGTTYNATITATSASGLYAEWEMQMTATKRTA